MARTYPFTEPYPQGGMTDWTITTHKPNPFHGIDRWLFAFDEFNHRHGLNERGPLRWFCNWWDHRLLGE